MPQRPSDLAGHSCLHHCFNITGKLERWPLIWTDDEPEIALPVSMVSNNIDGRICFAKQGLGIACLPEFSVRTALAAGRLQVVLPTFTDVRAITLRIFWPSGRHATPKVKALVDFLA